MASPLASTDPPVLEDIITSDSSTISLVFNKILDKPSAEAVANYRLDGINVVKAVLNSNETRVTLNISPSLLRGVTYTLYLNGIKDRQGNTLPASTQKTFRLGSNARISIAADGRPQVFFNGSFIGTVGSWEWLSIYNVSFQDYGTIAILCNGVRGFLAEISVDGRPPFGSSSDWKVSLSPPWDWISPDFNDDSWSNAEDLGPYGIGPWGKGVNGIADETPAHWLNGDGWEVAFRYTFTPENTTTFNKSVVLEKDFAFQVFPNPFNPCVQIGLPRFQGQGLVRIYDVSGKCVREYRIGHREKRLVWDGKDAGDRSVSSGMYTISFIGGQGETLRKKVMLMR